MDARPSLRLTLRGFKSFRDETVEFANPTYLVGRNGAGKSNLLSALQFLSDLAETGKLPPAPGGAFEIQLIWTPVGYEAPFHYDLVVHDQGFLVERGSHDGDTFERIGSDATGAWESLREEHPGTYTMPAKYGHVIYAALRMFLAGTRTYDPVPAEMRRTNGEPDPSGRLKADCSDAAACFASLEENARELAVGWLKALLPGLEGVQAVRTPGNIWALSWKMEGHSDDFASKHMSDGTLRCLGLILAVLQPKPVSLLLLEEPENNIHPGALDIVREIIDHASEQSLVIVSTQSAELLDHKTIRPESIRVVTFEDGASRCRPLSEAGMALVRGRDMTPGDMLRSGVIR